MNDLRSLLPSILQQIHLSPELTEGLIFSLWKSVVGETLAQNAKPTRLHRTTLVVSVPSQTWRRELFALRFDILRKLERVVGKEHVLALEFRVDPHMKSEPEESETRDATETNLPAPISIGDIADLELSQRLNAAAASYFNRPK